MAKHGFREADWEAAKEEAREVLIATAKQQRTIAYSHLVERIQTIHLAAHDRRLFHLLREISCEEDAQGHGLLSVVVVSKHGEQTPGQGFFELAKGLGRDTSDKYQCWIGELNQVYQIWQAQPGLEETT